MAILPPDPRYIFRGDMGCVHCVLFQINPNSEHLCAGTTSGNVYIWNLKTNRELLRFATGDDSCLSLHSTDKHNLFVQLKGGVIKEYKLTDSEWILNNTFDTDFCHYCRFQGLSENEILVPLKNSNVAILSTQTFALEARLDPSDLPAHEKLGDAMVIKPLKNKSELVLVGYEGGQLLLWDIRQRKVLSRLAVESTPMALDFDTFFRRGVIGGPSKQVQVFNLSTSHSLSDKTKLAIKNPGTSIIAIRPDAKVLAVGGWDSRVRIFSWKSLRPLAVLNQHRDTVHDITYSPSKVEAYDKKYLMATAAKDGCMALWDIYN